VARPASNSTPRSSGRWCSPAPRRNTREHRHEWHRSRSWLKPFPHRRQPGPSPVARTTRGATRRPNFISSSTLDYAAKWSATPVSPFSIPEATVRFAGPDRRPNAAARIMPRAHASRRVRSDRTQSPTIESYSPDAVRPVSGGAEHHRAGCTRVHSHCTGAPPI
jgi:hypothetical protein